MASYLYRTAQPFTLATFRSWGSSTGAGRIRLAAANIAKYDLMILHSKTKIYFKVFLIEQSRI
jgi:hypothetical protein